MKRITLTALTLFMAFALVASEPNDKNNGPEYANDESKAIIEKMLAAHGGYEKWAAIETMAFTSAMHSESLGLGLPKIPEL